MKPDFDVVESKNILALDSSYEAKLGQWFAMADTYCATNNEDDEFEFLPREDWVRRVLLSDGEVYVAMAIPLDTPADTSLIARMRYALDKAGHPPPDDALAMVADIAHRDRRATR